ncbi:MAG: NUDIX domain-containing protein [Candidatus Saccharibacteria bacterium]
MIYDTATPYVAAYVLLRRANTLAFVLRSHTGYMDGMYGLPSGKVEKNETFRAAAVREAREEIGVEIDPQVLQPALTMHRAGESGSSWVDVYFSVPTWQGEPSNAEPDKHGELAWLAVDDLPANIVPSVRAGLQAMARGEFYSEFAWPTS